MVDDFNMSGQHGILIIENALQLCCVCTVIIGLDGSLIDQRSDLLSATLSSKDSSVDNVAQITEIDKNFIL